MNKLFEYAVTWEPTDKQVKDEGAKAKIIVPPTTVLGKDVMGVSMQAAINIPAEYKDQLDQINIAVRPF